jgi:hypothetical protein
MSGLFGRTPEPQKIPKPKVVRMPIEDDPARLVRQRQQIAARRGYASTRMALRNTTGTNKLGSGGTGVT